MKFTLIEVVISLMILSLSLAGMLRLLTHSQSRISVAEERWREMHMLTQGAEYILLAGTESDLNVPDDVFPYDDYLIECTVDDNDDIPEDFTGQENQLLLKKWTIKLIKASDRSERLKVIIDRFDYSDAGAEDETK
ncbi:MAG: type II secretion system protein [Lentisphaeria bacterium]|nr:type II secretion system protein [Lentisphaeria bacterium]